jgi:hypothetical protein
LGRAQQVRGTVTLPDTTTRVVGAIVVANTPGAADAVARALTDERGQFTLRLPKGGRYGLRLLRIGYAPTVVEPFEIGATETVTGRFVLSGGAVVIAAVRVRGENVCRISQDSGQLVAKLWEEARTALTATQLSGDDALLDGRWLTYERSLDRSGRLVRSQKVRVTAGSTRSPFVSVSADSLERAGYIVDAPGGTVYHAPDASALLSDGFAASHCFQVEPPSADAPDRLAIRFRPARRREQIVDIEGRFLLDAKTAELRSLDFRYTNVPGATLDAEAGGRVEFMRLRTGHWFVRRWELRMPGLAKIPASNSLRGARIEERLILESIATAGGEVLDVARGRDTLFTGGGVTYRIRIVASDTLVGTQGATIDLAAGGYAGTVDATGVVTLQHVLPGTYQGRLSTPWLREAGLPYTEHRVTVSDPARATVDSLVLPNAATALTLACGSTIAGKRDGLLFGVLQRADGEPATGVPLTAVWKSGMRIENNTARYEPSEARAMSDALGTFRMCGVPRETPITVRAQRAEGPPGPTLETSLLLTEPLKRVIVRSPP